MNDRAAAVIVGGGVIGAAVAYQLARRNAGKVVLVERGPGVGEGSTGASSAICRCRYTHAEVVRLARDGQEAYRHWPEFTGLTDPTCSYVETGVLWLMGEEPSTVEADVTRLRAEGVEASAVTPADVAELFPALSDCGEPFDLSGEVPHVCRPYATALFEERGGYADAPAAAADLIEAARRHGADVRFRSEVTGIRQRGGRVTGIELADGDQIDTPVVLYRDWPSDLGPIPVVGDASTGTYFRLDARGSRVLLGSILAEDEEDVVDPDHWRAGADASFRDVKIHGLHHRIPALEHRGGVTGIAGLYTINREDVHPVVGPTELEGFWVANGFSGHGFKLAPMIGSMVAQALTGERATFDTDVPLEFFAVDREPIPVGRKTVLA